MKERKKERKKKERFLTCSISNIHRLLLFSKMCQASCNDWLRLKWPTMNEKCSRMCKPLAKLYLWLINQLWLHLTNGLIVHVSRSTFYETCPITLLFYFESWGLMFCNQADIFQQIGYWLTASRKFSGYLMSTTWWTSIHISKRYRGLSWGADHSE